MPALATPVLSLGPTLAERNTKADKRQEPKASPEIARNIRPLPIPTLDRSEIDEDWPVSWHRIPQLMDLLRSWLEQAV